MAWAADPTNGSWLLFPPRHPARSLQELDWPEAFRTLASGLGLAQPCPGRLKEADG